MLNVIFLYPQIYHNNLNKTVKEMLNFKKLLFYLKYIYIFAE